MNASSLNPHITISSPFGVADLPTLCVWRNRLHRLNGEPEEDLDAFMQQHLGREDVRTFAAYRDEELGGYFCAEPGELTFFADSSTAAVDKVEMVFKREFFKRRPEKENGASAGGQEITRPALNLVLRELFEEFELAFFPLKPNDLPIQSLVKSIGAVSVGAVDEAVLLFVLSRPEWEKVNAQFIAECELAEIQALQLEAASVEVEAPIFARSTEQSE